MNNTYSPFFTSGLYPSASESDLCTGARRGSLPTDSLTPSAASSTRTGSSFYFTLQPTRDEKEYRSFLSLDLAESKPTQNTTQRTLTPPSPKALRLSLSARKVPSPKPAPSASLPDVPSPKPSPSSSLPLPSSSAPASSSSSSSSRSLTPLAPSPAPSPKPTVAPIASTSASAPLSLPRNNNIQVRISRTPTPASTTAVIVPQKRGAPSAPSASYARSKKHTRSSTLSTVSTRARRVNRSVALDRLEGRGALGLSPPTSSWIGKAVASAPPHVTTFRSNFMSLSDDESSSSEDDVDSLGARSDYTDSDLDDDEDFFSFGSSSSRPRGDSTNSRARGDNRAFYGAWLEEEDSVLPVVSPSMTPCRERSEWISRSSLSSSSSVVTTSTTPLASSPLATSALGMSISVTSVTEGPKSRSRSGTTNAGGRNRSGSMRRTEWFPLKSFIDLRSTSDAQSLDASSIYPSLSASRPTSSTLSLGPLPLNPFAFDVDSINDDGQGGAGRGMTGFLGMTPSPQAETPGEGGWRWRSFIDVASL